MGTSTVAEHPAADTMPAYVFEDITPQAEMVPIDERVLGGVDYLLERRLPDGTYADVTLDAAHINHVTATKEMAIPHAISRVHLPKIAEGVYMFNDQTSIDVARSGYRYHYHPAAHARVGVEVAEATHNAVSLEPSKIRVFISPRMSERDAPQAAAKSEHLADDDAIRITGITTDEYGNPADMVIDAILLKDVPLEAWVTMLRDPHNVFGKSITVADADSALSVMKAFYDLELPVGQLPGGVKDVVRGVIPYITDPEARTKVESHYEKLHADQDEIHRKASSIADRWLAFDIEMAESLHQGRATAYIKDFVRRFHDSWGEKTRQLLYMHTLDDGELYMSRNLAVKIEEVRIKTLWLKSAISNGNAEVITQMDGQIVAEVMRSEERIQFMIQEGYRIHEVLAADNANNNTVAKQQVTGGGGCPGNITADILTAIRQSKMKEKKGDNDNKMSLSQDKKDGKKDKATKEEIMKCVTCPLCKKPGVDAHIQHFTAVKRITCSKCHQSKEYAK